MELFLIAVCVVMAWPWPRIKRLVPADYPNVSAEQFAAWRRVRMRSLNLFLACAVIGLVLWAGAYYLGYNFGHRIPQWLVLTVGIPTGLGWIVLIIIAFTSYARAQSLARTAGIAVPPSLPAA